MNKVFEAIIMMKNNILVVSVYQKPREFIVPKLCHHFSKQEYLLPRLIHLEMFLKIICPNWLASIIMMSDHIPFIKSHEISLIKDEMAQKNIGIIILMGQRVLERHLLLL